MAEHRYVLIMAGGVGARFWPASREARPKQFLDILGIGKSLLRLTYERCIKIVPSEHIYIITNQKYADQVAEHLPELEREQIFTEPSMNNTAPCIAYASLKLAKRDPEGVCLVAPSDHVIMDEDAFVATVQRGFDYAREENVLLTMGMTPTRPDTGYGYIQYDTEETVFGIHRVRRFTEKPQRDKAIQFIASGDYLWNSGMFIWSLNSVLDAFSRYASKTYEILKAGVPSYFTDEEDAFLAEEYPKTERTSVDYAIMESADNVYVVPAEFGWSDLGTWASLYEKLEKNTGGNVTVHAPVIMEDCDNSMVHTTAGKLVIASGLKDMILICEDDAVLVFPRDDEQKIKLLREQLKSEELKRYL